nr:MAG TPA: hypothetical protein [Caudoviricetes sp.]
MDGVNNLHYPLYPVGTSPFIVNRIALRNPIAYEDAKLIERHLMELCLVIESLKLKLQEYDNN